MKDKNYNILVSFDDKYVDKAMNMLYSLKLYNNARFNVYIFFIELSDNSIKKIQTFFKKYKIENLFLHKYNLDIDEFPINLDHTSVETYIRLFVPFIIDVDKLLYLDCDIICNGDITKFYDTNIDNYYVAAVENKSPLESEEFNPVMNENLDLPANNKYVNAGVLLINTLKIKNDFSIEKMMNFIDDNREILIMQDQDIINKLFYKKIKLVSNIYNYQINGYEDNELINNPILIHYSDSLKPWNRDYPSRIKAKYYYDILQKLGKDDELNFLLNDYDNEIDIIIPVYNSNSTLPKALNSINNLVNKNETKIYIIDDGSTESYEDTINTYGKNLDILYFKLDTNKGPGYARNYGINVSNGKYIIFLDSDDYFAKKSSVKRLYDSIENSEFDEIRSSFKRISGDSEMVFQEDNLGVHGKIYRRSFIKDNNIKFSNTRSFEDTYFNTLIFINNGNIKDIDDMTYYWCDNVDSLTNTESIDNKILDYASNMYEILSSSNYINSDRWLNVVFDSLYFIYLYYDNCSAKINEIDDFITKILKLLYVNNTTIYELFDEYYIEEDEFKKFIEKYIVFNKKLINEYNASNIQKKNDLLKEKFAEFGEDNIIETPINTNCGGRNLHIGSGVYINFGLSLVDNGNIYIGDDTFIGPNVNILTLNHAINLKDREKGNIEIKDVIIGKNVWIGAGAIILPGVVIGDNSVIGAGSVVTKDIPSDVVAVGNPCRVIKEINK